MSKSMMMRMMIKFLCVLLVFCLFGDYYYVFFADYEFCIKKIGVL